jgi:hypothetical protein
MLDLKSNQRNNWIGFALAHHLRGEYEEAAKVLKVYEDTETAVSTWLRRSVALKNASRPLLTPRGRLQNEDSGPAEDYEKSEMLMYKNMVIQESGDLPKALAHLDEIASDVVDGLALRQTRGEWRGFSLLI